METYETYWEFLGKECLLQIEYETELGVSTFDAFDLAGDLRVYKREYVVVDIVNVFVELEGGECVFANFLNPKELDILKEEIEDKENS